MSSKTTELGKGEAYLSIGSLLATFRGM